MYIWKWSILNSVLKKSIMLGFATAAVGFLLTWVPTLITPFGPCGPANDFFLIPYILGSLLDFILTAIVIFVPYEFMDFITSNILLETIFYIMVFSVQAIVWSFFWYLILRKKYKNQKEISLEFTGKKISENVLINNILDENGAKIYKGNKYVSQKDMEGEAFCLGCRSIDVLSNLYYCRETDQYYHEKCIGINN